MKSFSTIILQVIIIIIIKDQGGKRTRPPTRPPGAVNPDNPAKYQPSPQVPTFIHLFIHVDIHKYRYIYT
jgi:hypothetical protein